MANDIGYRIIEKAAELFPRLGFSKVTVDELCEEIGISKKTLYRYFTSKDEIADAVYKWNVATIKNGLQKIIQGHGTYLERLYKLCEFIAQFLSRMNKAAQQDLIRHRPDLWKRLELYRKQEIFPVFKDILDEGIKLGIVRDDVQKDLILLVLASAVEGILTPEVLTTQSFSTEDAFRGIINIFFNGVLMDKARSDYNKKALKNKEGQKRYSKANKGDSNGI
jgi:AcrR family transcriptional regulator